MFNTIGRLAAGLGAGAALVLGASGPVFASSGATVSNDGYQCFAVEEGGGSICLDVHEVFQNVITPTGNSSFVDNYRTDVYLYSADGQLTFSSQARGQIHGVYNIQTGTFLAFHEASNTTINSPDGTSCTLIIRYHSANGQIQFDRPGGTCLPE